MSKKQTDADSNNEEENDESSDLLFPQSNNAKRAKLASLSDTTLQDLPMEVIEYILVEVVAMEVKDMKLAKSVWKEKADLVISRLRTVCSHWSNILTTDFFRNEVNRTLDRTVQDAIRLDILHQFPISFHIYSIATMKDEIFMLKSLNSIVVYNRINMAAAKDVIELSDTLTRDLVACNVSNCLYALSRGMDVYSVLRIKRDEEQQFEISTWIREVNHCPSMSISASGSLIILSLPNEGNPSRVNIYDANCCLQHEITLSPGIYCLRCVDNAIQKSNGNLLLISFKDQSNTDLTEIDATGNIVRKYVSSLGIRSAVHFADNPGRFVITESDDRIKLLDAEFNLLDFTGPLLNGSMVHYDYERDEVVSVLSVGRKRGVVTIFRFAEE